MMEQTLRAGMNGSSSKNIAGSLLMCNLVPGVYCEEKRKQTISSVTTNIAVSL